MQLKLFPAAALVAALLLISATGAAAQTGQISGKVTLKQADGSVVPVAGAVIDIYRTDLKQTFQVKTSRRGDYMHTGVPIVGTYTIAVSAPGARPNYRAGVRPARQTVDFELVPGDGSRLTLEAAFKEYIAVETDPAKKAKARLDMAQMLLDAGAADKALTEFRAILATQPDSPEANLGAGLAIYAAADKTKFQEAANYLQRFVEVAPDTNPRKDDANAILKELEVNENVTPQVKKPLRRRP